MSTIVTPSTSLMACPGSSGRNAQSSSSSCSSLFVEELMDIDVDALIAAEQEKDASALAQAIIQKSPSKKVVRIIDPKENILYRNGKRLCEVTVISNEAPSKSAFFRSILKPWSVPIEIGKLEEIDEEVCDDVFRPSDDSSSDEEHSRQREESSRKLEADIQAYKSKNLIYV